MAISKHFHSPANPWFANAMRSMGLGGASLIKDISPSIYDFGSSLNTARKTVADATRKARSSDSRMFVNGVKNSQYMKVANDFYKNALSDIKTGKFVNKERRDEVMTSGMGLDFDFSFDDLNVFDDDDSAPSVVNENVVISSNPDVVNATFAVQNELREQRKEQIKSSKAQVDSMVALTSSSMMEIKGLGTSILSSLGSINSNLGALVEYQNQNMTRYIEASLEYYKQTSYEKRDDTPASSKFDLSSVFASSGAINLQNYGAMVKDRAKKNVGNSELGLILSMFDKSGGMSMADMLTASPLEFIPKMLLKKAMPKNVQNSMKDLGKAFGSFMPTLMNRIADIEDDANGWDAKSGFMRMMAKMFGVREENKDKFSMNKFEKGAVPFDGLTRHTIVEIIPKYLRESTGYLRELMESVTGKDSKTTRRDAFNWETGKYESEAKLKKEIYDSIKNDILLKYEFNSEFGDAMARKKYYLDEKSQEKYQSLLEKMYLALTESSKTFNHKDLFTGDPLKDLIPDIDDDPKIGKYLRASMKSLNQSEALNINKVKNEARRSKKEMIERMENDPYSNNLYLTAGDRNISAEMGSATFNKSASTPKSSSKSLSAIDYLRDIKFILNRGINVRMAGAGTYAAMADNTEIVTGSNTPQASSAIIGVKETKRSKKDSVSQATMTSDTGNIDHMSEEETLRYIQSMENTSAPVGRGAKAAGSVNKLSSVLYAFAFGSAQNATDAIGNIIKEKFDKMAGWVKEKVFTPMKDIFVGKENENGYKKGGIFSGVQNSIKDIMKGLSYEMTGKGYTNSKGETKENKNPEDTAWGKVKSVFTNLKDSTMITLFGKKKDGQPDDGADPKDKKKGMVANAISSIKGGFTEWRNLIFGKDFSEKESKEINKKLADSVKEKLPGALAGTVLGAGAGILAGGNVGLMGSLFLPGGPIGGAILGTAVGFAAQSKTFRDIMFGKEVDGQRIGGLINKKTQDFMKENKDFIVGGAVLGGIKSAVMGNGIMGSLMFGPFTGALLGAGLGIAKKSKAFQEFLYGSGEDGDRKGIITAFKDKFKDKDIKNRFGMGVSGAVLGGLSASVIGQMGLVGAMLTPMGPIGGAIMGAGFGIAAASDKFKNYMFGDKDEEGKRKGGVMGRLTDYLGHEVFTPMKQTIKKVSIDANYFLTSKVLGPIQDAFEPLVFQMKAIGNKIKGTFLDMGGKIMKTVNEKVLDPIVENVDKYLVSPMKKIGSKLFNLIFGAIGKILSAPGALLGGLTNALVGKQKRGAVKDERNDILSRRAYSEGKRGFSWLGGLVMDTFANNYAAGKLSFSTRAKEEVANKRIDYYSGWKDRREERAAKAKARYDQEMAEFNAEKAESDAKRKKAKASGYRELNVGAHLRNVVLGEELPEGVDESNYSNKKSTPIINDVSEAKKPRSILSVMKERRAENDKLKDTRKAEDEESKNARKLTRAEEKSRRDSARKAEKEKKRQAFEAKRSVAKSAHDAKIATIDEKIEAGKKARNDKNAPAKSTKDATLKNETPKEETKTASVDSTVSSTTQSESASSTKKQSSVAAQREMPRNVRDIRDAVKGQLNGVGSNIFRIRKLLEKRLKADETDEEGSDNRERTTIKDKLGAFFTSGPGHIILAPFRAVSNVVYGITDGIARVWEGIKSIPAKIGHAVVAVGKGIKDLTVGILKTGRDLLLGVGDVVVGLGKGVVSALGIAGKAVVGTVGGILGGAANLIGATISGIGNVVSSLATGAATLVKSVPALLEGVGVAVGGIVRSIGSVVSAAASGVASIATGALKIVKETGKMIGNAVLAPLKLLGGLVGGVVGAVTGKHKRQKTQVFRGGYLERIEQPVTVITEKDKPIHVIVDKALTPLEVLMGESGDNKSDKDISGSSDPKKLTMNERVLGALLDIKNVITGNGEKSQKGGRRFKTSSKKLESATINPTSEMPVQQETESVVTHDGSAQNKQSESSPNKKPGLLSRMRNNFQKGFTNYWNESQQVYFMDPTMNKLGEEWKNSRLRQMITGKSAKEKDAEEDAKRNAALAAETKQNYEDANNKTAEFQRTAREEEAKKLKDANGQSAQIGLLKNIAQDTHEHSQGWLGMFGNKSILGTALLVGVPMLFKLVKSFMDGSFLNKIGEWGSQFVEDLIFGFNNVGGFGGMINNAGNLLTDFASVFGFGDKAYNEDGTKKGFFTRAGEFIFGEDGHDAMTDAKLNYLRAKGTKVAKVVKKGSKVVKGVTSGIHKAGSAVFNKFAGPAMSVTEPSNVAKFAGAHANKSTASVARGVSMTAAREAGEGSITKFANTTTKKASLAATGTGSISKFANAQKITAPNVLNKGGKQIGLTPLSKAGKNAGVESMEMIAAKKAGVTSATFAKTAVETAESGKVNTIMSWVTKAFDTILDHVKKFAKSNGLSKVDDVIKLIGTAKSKLSLSVLGKFAKKFAKPLAKVAMAAGTALASDVLWGLFGAVDGATSAANLFQLGKDGDVDGKMILISAAIKALLSTSVGSFIDIMNEILVEIAGIDLITEIACLLYSVMASEEDVKALNASRDSAKAEYNQYADQAYQDAYELYAEDAGASAVDFETWKKSANVKVKSFADYNDDTNKSLGRKIGDAISDGWSTVKGWFGFGKKKKKKKKKEDAEVTAPTTEAGLGLGGSTSPTLANSTLSTDFFGAKMKEFDVWTNDFNKGFINGLTGIDNYFGHIFGMTDSAGNPISLSEGTNQGFGKLTANVSPLWKKAGTFFTTIRDTLAVAGEKVNGLGFGVPELTKSASTMAYLSTGLGYGSTSSSDSGLGLGPVEPDPAPAPTPALNYTVKTNAMLGYNPYSAPQVTAVNGSAITYNPTPAPAPTQSLTSEQSNLAMGLYTTGPKLTPITPKPTTDWTDLLYSTGDLFKPYGLPKIDPGLPPDITPLNYAMSESTRMYVMAENRRKMNEWNRMTPQQRIDANSNIVASGGSIETRYDNYANVSDIYQNFAYFSQRDPRWQNKPYYGGKTIGEAGCGPTSMAMVATSLIGNKYYPDEMTNKSLEWGTYELGSGTTPGFFEKASKEYGLQYKSYSASGLNKDGLIRALDNGQPLIISGKNSGQSTDASPFTDAGHLVVAHGYTDNGDGLIINDPRGDSYSKVYRTADVLMGAKRAFSFTDSGSAHPTPISGNDPFPVFGYDIPYSTDGVITSEYSAGAAPAKKQSALSLIGSFLTGLSDAAFNGILTGNWDVDWAEIFGDSGAYNSSDASVGGYDAAIYKTPTNFREELATKVLELTRSNEGGYSSVNPNDAGSGYSVGMMQFHGGKSQTFFKRLAEQLTDSADAQTALKWAGRAGSALSSTEAAEMRAFLESPSVSDINKQIQYDYAIELIEKENMATALDMYAKGELLDPRSIVLIADIANTGSKHVASWRKNYTPTKDKGSELARVAASLRSPASYWGNPANQGGEFTKGWTNRIQETYEKLNGWSPKYVDMSGMGLGDGSYTLRELLNPEIKSSQSGLGLGMGRTPKSSSVSVKNINTPSKGFKRTSLFGLGLGTQKTGVTRSVPKTDTFTSAYRNLQTAHAYGADTSVLERLMSKVVTLLESISGNTLSAADKLDLLKSLSVSNSNGGGNTTVVVPKSSKGSNANGSAMSLGEKVARNIALGKA